MHVLCLITYKVRSENGYGFLRPGLTTDVGNGSFGLKLGLDLEIQAAHPTKNSKGYLPGKFHLEFY